MKKSWKTTTAGIGAILVAVGSILQSQFDGDPTTVPQYEVAIAAIMAGIVGLFARDNDVSSEESGAK